jgi:PD-(D/E)XK nuclease superfamily
MQPAPYNSSFSQVIPNLQLAWDSTSLGELKACPRKYFYSIICGFQPRSISVHLTFGLHYHKALEVYDHFRSRGSDHQSATRMAIRQVLSDTWDPVLKRPWASDDSNKNRLTLLRSVVWYLDQFEIDSLETVQLKDGKPAVELSFRLLTNYTSPTGEPFLLCGHFDRVAKFNNQAYIVDRKTSKSQINSDFFDKFNPDNQMSLYAFASQVVYEVPVAGVIIDGAQIGATFTRFQRGFTLRTESQLEEWYKDLGVWLVQASVYAANNHWPMNDKSCGNYGGCPFRPICSKPEAVRAEWLKAGYARRIWDPLQIRGDI